MIKTILVAGGMGFIGSSIVEDLIERSYNVVVMDRDCKPNNLIPGATYIYDDICDSKYLRYASFDAIIHLAANHVVPLSVVDPLSFYDNNLRTTIQLVKKSQYDKIPIIFSSTAAVYGSKNGNNLLTENSETDPINSYGRSKLWSEQIITECSEKYGFDALIFRFFNVAGSGKHSGYISRNPSHAIPILLKKAENNEPFTVFGSNYPTADGTCVRDYLHVKDISNAHILGLEYLFAGGKTQTMNLGTGKGVSVLELINETEYVLGKDINYFYDKKRAGDPAFLVADATKALNVLNWKPRHSMTQIIRDSYNWEKKGIL